EKRMTGHQLEIRNPSLFGEYGLQTNRALDARSLGQKRVLRRDALKEPWRTNVPPHADWHSDHFRHFRFGWRWWWRGYRGSWRSTKDTSQPPADDAAGNSARNATRDTSRVNLRRRRVIHNHRNRLWNSDRRHQSTGRLWNDFWCLGHRCRR